MVPVNSVWQNVIFAAFAIAWFGGAAIPGFRFRAKQRAYLHRFPPGEGVPLDMYAGLGPPSVKSAVVRALNQRQADPELERLRQEMWQYYRRHVVVWIFGFPILCFGVMALVIATGFVRPVS
jgi:hypothetical protein